MKKLFLYIFLALLWCNTVYSEWIHITHATTKNAKFYIDPETVAKVDDTKFFWMLIDQNKPVDDVMSRKVHIQIKCKLYRYKMHSIILYKKPMGKGSIFRSITEGFKWNSAPPDSAVGIIMKSIC
tara:strand:+ start:48 stop:422 length:375 start_codon:yes stop_codon:yes gene_type:complete